MGGNPNAGIYFCVQNMTITVFTLILFLGALVAGFTGSLTGLGGGVIIIPMLTLIFHVDIRYAIGASLISVIATSSGAASAYVKEGITNIRIGMLLEIATTIGAVCGAVLAVYMPSRIIAIIFGLILIISAGLSLRKRVQKPVSTISGKLADWFRLNSSYPLPEGDVVEYKVRHVPGGFMMMYVAGIVSGLLGIGSGALKVIAMDRIMNLPFKVSTATSNFMIGVTAAASTGVYLARGYIDPGLCMPVILGVLAGALTGAKILYSVNSRILRIIFAVVIAFLAVQMIIKGINGNL
jgi:uncharacterized protein